MMRSQLILMPVLSVLALSACAPAPRMQYATGVSAMTVDTTRQGPVSGVGVEGHDIATMSDVMVRDILSDDAFMALIASGKRPVITVDGEDFVNASSQAFSKDMITTRLRSNLQRASKNKLTFTTRKDKDFQSNEKERALKRSGVVDTGTRGLARAQRGVDFRLGGEIQSLDSRSTSTGMIQRTTQIEFKITDIETGELVWTNIYEFTRAGADDVVYR